jgi:hypothetical protein
MSGQFLTEHRVLAGSHPNYRHDDPAYPTTWVTLLTGGLLVRIAQRFFVSPYSPNLIDIVDQANVKRSDDGGNSWQIDVSLQNQLTSGESDFSQAGLGRLP